MSNLKPLSMFTGSHITDFETARLLKQRGVVIPTQENLVVVDEVNNIEEHRIKNREVVRVGSPLGVIAENEYQVYYLREVLDWLWTAHNLWVDVFVDDNKLFGFMVTRFTEEGRVDSPLTRGFESPGGAFAAAIKVVVDRDLI